MNTAHSAVTNPQDSRIDVAEVVEFCSALIRFNTTNHGGADGADERFAANYIADRLREVGLQFTLFEPAPRRVSVICRIAGEDQSLPGLVIHAHLDTVPVTESEWSVDPFGGEVRDDAVWGRGAIDMKNVCAMMLAAARSIARRGVRPRRDIVFVWFADEEAGGEWGAQALLRDRPDLIAGCDTAISEVGGFSVELPNGKRGYLLETEQKGVLWIRLTANGRGGHGSLPHTDAAPASLVSGLSSILTHDWATNPADELLASIPAVPGMQRWIDAATATTCNLTHLDANGSSNVVATRATADLDCRTLVADADSILDRIQNLVANTATVTVIREDAPTTTPLHPEFESAALNALRMHDPDPILIPFRMPIASDNRFFRAHGFKAYGFIPMQIPPEFDLASMFHGVDEHVPTTSLTFGTDVLTHLLCNY